MSVKSVSTKDMTKQELEALRQDVRRMKPGALRSFRESFPENEMGFSGRKEGI